MSQMKFLSSGSLLLMLSFVSDNRVTEYTANFGRKTCKYSNLFIAY